MFEIGSYYYNRNGDIVQVTRMVGERGDLAYCNIVVRSNKKRLDKKGYEEIPYYNFWTKSGSRLYGEISHEGLANNENKQTDYDVLTVSPDPEKYPELYI